VDVRAGLFNLLGCCAFLNQNFEAAMQYFRAALKLAGEDARLHQNAALACELQGLTEQADDHWDHFHQAIDGRLPTAPGRPDYLDRLRYEALHRLAAAAYDREDWERALTFYQRAARLRPEDPDLLERLFHLYTQVRRPEEAGRTLRRLRQVRSNDPLLELYELDLGALKSLDDAERLLADIDRVLKKYPDDPRLEERAGGMVATVVAYLDRLGQQAATQLDKSAARVRRLTNYRANWPEMYDFLRDLNTRLGRLKRVTARCLLLVATDAQRRRLRALRQQIDRDVERGEKLLRG
jgi:tetratricopeptide (TPR) repeat protein